MVFLERPAATNAYKVVGALFNTVRYPDRYSPDLLLKTVTPRRRTDFSGIYGERRGGTDMSDSITALGGAAKLC